MNTLKHTWLRANTFRCQWFWLLFKCRIHCCCSGSVVAVFRRAEFWWHLKSQLFCLSDVTWVADLRSCIFNTCALVNSWCGVCLLVQKDEVGTTIMRFNLLDLRAAFVPIFMTTTWKQKKCGFSTAFSCCRVCVCLLWCGNDERLKCVLCRQKSAGAKRHDNQKDGSDINPP